MAKRRKAVKDTRSGVANTYLSGVAGSQRAQLASVIKQISRLYKAGKTVPQSLIKRRIKLGKKKK